MRTVTIEELYSEMQALRSEMQSDMQELRDTVNKTAISTTRWVVGISVGATVIITSTLALYTAIVSLATISH